MKIGLLSDSHDNLKNIEKTVNFFNRHNVRYVLHAGDFVAPFTIPKLKRLKCEWLGVFGNNDGEKKGLFGASEGRIRKGPLRFKLGKKKITLVHDIKTINPNKEGASCIIFGHTHKPQILEQATRLIVNPGECGGWLTGNSTLALVDLDSLKGKIYQI
jgi:putative phosphoesterase